MPQQCDKWRFMLEIENYLNATPLRFVILQSSAPEIKRNKDKLNGKTIMCLSWDATTGEGSATLSILIP